MKLSKILITFLLFVAINSYGQSNFSFTPEKPQAGEPITITYTPSGLITNTDLALEAVAYNFPGKKGVSAQEIQMKKSGKVFTGTISTDTSSNLIFFKFSAGDQIDNNNNKGYWIQLYADGKLKKGADYSVALFYRSLGRDAGIDPTYDKALKYLDREYDHFPEDKKKDIVGYLQIYSRVHKDIAPALIQKEIESAMNAGLKDEGDYDKVQQLYALNNLTQQSAFIDQLKKDKFPQGKWTVEAMIEKYYNDTDLATKSNMLDKMITKINSDPNWEYLRYGNNLKAELASTYIYKKD
jgi:hypothetical protein